MLRKKTNLISELMIACGIVMLILAAMFAGYNVIVSNLAKKDCSDVVAVMEKNIDAYIERKESHSDDEVETDDTPTIIYIDNASYIGMIEIPALDKVLPVQNESDVKKLAKSPCRYSGSIAEKNMVICAHNYNSFFGDIKRLRKGDTVIFEDMEGNRYYHKVDKVETLDRNAVRDMISSGYDLTLYTCTRDNKARVTVRCVRED